VSTHRLLGLRVDRERLQRHRGEQEDDREARQQDVQGDLVGRLLPLRALDEGDHPVDERLARLRRDLHDDAVREHLRAAGHGAAVAPGLPDHGRRLARDGRFVHGGHALDDFAVARDDLVGLDDAPVAGHQLGAGDRFLGPVGAQAPGHRFLTGRAQGRRLGLAAALGDGLGQVREDHGEPEPDDDQAGEQRRVLQEEEAREQGADPDDEHHRVLPEHAGIQLSRRIGQRGPHEMGVDHFVSPSTRGPSESAGK
jgi:hypothetical protein